MPADEELAVEWMPASSGQPPGGGAPAKASRNVLRAGVLTRRGLGVRAPDDPCGLDGDGHGDGWVGCE